MIYVWLGIGLAVIFAIIGYIADKKGYFGNNKAKEVKEEFVNFDELSKPKEEIKKPKEEDISSSFDTLPDFEMPKVETKPEVNNEIDEDLYAPFGDQNVVKEEIKDSSSVSEVEEDNYTQNFVDVDKIETEAHDIINEDDKVAVSDLMKSQYDLNFEVEGAEETTDGEDIFVKAEKEEAEANKTKENEEINDMWNF